MVADVCTVVRGYGSLVRLQLAGRGGGHLRDSSIHVRLSFVMTVAIWIPEFFIASSNRRTGGLITWLCWVAWGRVAF